MPSRKEKNQDVSKRSTKRALGLYRTAESTSPKGMLHALFPANAAGPARSRDRVGRLRVCLMGPRREASVALQREMLIDQRAGRARPGGLRDGRWPGCPLDWGRSRLGQDIDARRSVLIGSWS